MKPYFDCGNVTLYLGKCEEVMRDFADGIFDSVVTDAPYELGFMGKSWDATGIAYSVPMWQEVLRICKPGAHLLSFGGTRTYHRMACAIEDAGFEIRDQIQWLYGTGFPKALDVAKAIDQMQGTLGEVVAEHDNTYGINKTRKELGYRPGDVTPGVTRAPGSAEAEAWTGWKTALKPANEPICLARTPFKGSVAANVLKHGTSALNIDGCRIETDPSVDDMLREVDRSKRQSETWENGSGFKNETNNLTGVREDGRYPSNVIIDEFVAEVLDRQSGITTSGVVRQPKDAYDGESVTSFLRGRSDKSNQHGGSGGASRFYEVIEYSGEELLDFCRFYYSAKASKSERNAGLDGMPTRQKVFNGQSAESSKDMKDVEARFTTAPTANFHPTVKPIRLMRYLCRLITAPEGVVLDPFIGSGVTAIAALGEGLGCIGIDESEEYLEIAAKRIEYWSERRDQIPK